jgi:hypothetical protein
MEVGMAEVVHMKSKERTPFELTVETKMIYELLKTFEIEQFVSYEELSKLIGRDVQHLGRCNLSGAMRKCLMSDNMNFATVRNQGVKRLADPDVVRGGQALQRIGNIATKRRRALHAVDYPNLTKDLQKDHNAELSALGVLRHFSKDATVKKLLVHVEKAELPVGKTLKMFE